MSLTTHMSLLPALLVSRLCSLSFMFSRCYLLLLLRPWGYLCIHSHLGLYLRLLLLICPVLFILLYPFCFLNIYLLNWGTLLLPFGIIFFHSLIFLSFFILTPVPLLMYCTLPFTDLHCVLYPYTCHTPVLLISTSHFFVFFHSCTLSSLMSSSFSDANVCLTLSTFLLVTFILLSNVLSSFIHTQLVGSQNVLLLSLLIDVSSIFCSLASFNSFSLFYFHSVTHA